MEDDEFNNKNLLKRLAHSVGLYNVSKNQLINITIRPSKIRKSQYFDIKNIQVKLNLMYYNLAQDLDSYDFDDPLYKFLKSIYDEKKFNKKGITALLVRSDYLLDNDQYKQVEINMISQCFVSLGPLLNKIHSFVYPEVVVSDIDKNFVNFILKLKDVYEEKYRTKDTVIVMVDNDTTEKSSNYMEKVQLIRYFLENGVHLKFVKISELRFDDSHVYYNNDRISVVYYRWFYNYDQFDDISKDYKRRIELSSAISLPSVEFQMINSKLFQVVLADKAVLKKYTEDADEIHRFFGEFVLNKKEFDDKNLNKSDWLEKCVDEGGNSINKNKSESIYMKKFISPTVRNGFIDDTSMRNMINEVSVFGSLIEVDGHIIWNKEDGYIVRSKDEKSLEGGICSGNGGLDSLQLTE